MQAHAQQKEPIKTLDHAKNVFKQHQHHELAKLGERFAAQLENNTEPDDAKKLLKRTTAIAQTLESPYQKTLRKYHLSGATQGYVQKCLSPHSVHKNLGNAIENNIHEEVIDVVNKTANELHVNRTRLRRYSTIIFRSANIALDFKNQKNYVRAYTFSDFCSGLYEAIKTGTSITGQGVWKGVNQFSHSCKSFMDCFIYDPVATTKNTAQGVCRKLRELACDPATTVKKLCATIQKTYHNFIYDPKHSTNISSCE